MPIYEFRCLRCGEVFELLKLKTQDERLEMKCPECGSSNIERVLSKIGMVREKGRSTTTHVRQCSSGTCGTLTVPGPEK
ncbi:MAG TPA: zinc ribbon domain-containing protein [Candidatus Desulfofervidus auxilii]|uniref:Zinc ribbon domain-containing protein n=1 Tax=Desulfofervidus auxilii TaxID=1621989 RepID=A0A7V0IA73_DESA2|nr:zinc ribbon domain-containing protein [Candidatus Desulfofervidus auxilii]